MLDARIVEFERSVRADPDDAGAHLRLGQALERAGRERRAVRAYSKAAWLDPDGHVAPFCAGLLHESQGDVWSAVREYDRALLRMVLRGGARGRLPADSALLAEAARLGAAL